jgi:hypothetical protein
MGVPPPQGSYAAYAPPAAASSSQTDLQGIGHLKVGSILGLLVQVLLWVGFAIFYLIFNALRSTTTIYGTTSTLPSWITVNTFFAAIGLLAGGLVLGILSFIFFYLGFRTIKRGAPDFGAPTTLMLVGLIGFLMTVIGVLVIVGTIVSAINSAVAGTISSGTASVDISAILGGLALIGLGAILDLVGVVGLVLGNWRAGTRYGESTLRIGAILTILPYVSIVGYILLLVGYSKAGKKLQSGWAPAGPVPMAPAGYYAPPPGQQPPWQAPPPPPP